MSQFLRPDSIVTAGLWTGDPSGTNFYLDIDEVIRDDNDFAESNKNQATLGEAGLSDAFDPQTSDSHTFRYVIRMNAAKNVTIVVRLMQGSTTIGGWTHVNPATTFTLFERTTLAAISDYTDLRVQLDVTANAGANAWIEVSWVELEIPDAIASSDTPAFTYGEEEAFSSQDAYLEGKPAATPVEDSIPAFTWGEEEAFSATDVYLTGPILVTDDTPAYLEGTQQSLVPDMDTFGNEWVKENLSPTDLYVSVADESDSTYVQKEYAEVGQWFEIGLDDTGEFGGGAVYIQWRAWRISGANTLTLKAELREGESTIICTDQQVLTDAAQTFTYYLTQAEKDSITSIVDLRIRITIVSIT